MYAVRNQVCFAIQLYVQDKCGVGKELKGFAPQNCAGTVLELDYRISNMFCIK